MFVFRMAGAAAAALILSTNFAQAVSTIQLNPGALQILLPIGCVVAGTPVEFPNDIQLVNKAKVALVAGTKIQWSVDGYSTYKGTYTLTQQLAPGKAAFLSGVLGSGVEAGHPCKAKIL